MGVTHPANQKNLNQNKNLLQLKSKRAGTPHEKQNDLNGRHNLHDSYLQVHNIYKEM